MPNWIAHVFDHPVEEEKPEWYWSSEAPVWEESREHVATLIAETFERSGELLAGFSDAQLNQGFWYLASDSCSAFMRSLADSSVQVETRLRALRSFVPLFEQIMARRCSTHLSHLDEPGANVLNSACYMWWDILPIHGEPEKPDRAEFDAAVLKVFSRLLSIPHDACRESALHGISEWQFYYPSVSAVIENWLVQTLGLRPELVSYAKRARVGNVQ